MRERSKAKCNDPKDEGRSGKRKDERPAKHAPKSFDVKKSVNYASMRV